MARRLESQPTTARRGVPKAERLRRWERRITELGGQARTEDEQSYVAALRGSGMPLLFGVGRRQWFPRGADEQASEGEQAFRAECALWAKAATDPAELERRALVAEALRDEDLPFTWAPLCPDPSVFLAAGHPQIPPVAPVVEAVDPPEDLQRQRHLLISL